MASVLAQPVVVIPNLATFQSSRIASYAGGQAQVAYLQGTVTEFDGGQGFYQLADSDFTTPSNPPTVVVDGAGNRWFYANVSLTAAAIIALLTGTPLPIVAGGTGQASAGAALDALTIQGANIAAAATTNLATATGEFVVVTGNGGPITALGTATAGVFRFVRFTGAPTLTNNGTSLILPGGANISVAAGDTACFMSLGSGNWQCIFYTEIAGGTVGTLPVAQGGTGATTLTNHGVLLGQGTSAIVATAVGTTGQVLRGATGADPAFGALDLATDVTGALPIANGGTGQITSVAGYDALAAQGLAVTAAATTNLATATGPFVLVTGSAATITALGTATAGVQREVYFDGANTLTHNGTSLILPGAININTAANDTAAFVSLGSGNWLCLWYKVAGQAVYSAGSWTPTISFTTPGDLAVTYANQVGVWVRVGQLITLNCNLSTSAFTHTTASGTLVISGLPFTARTLTFNSYYGPGQWQGITSAGYTDLAARIQSAANTLNIVKSGTAVATATVAAADMPTGGSVILRFTLQYEAA